MKWSQNQIRTDGNLTDGNLNESQKQAAIDVLVSVLDISDIEVLQSAEIVYREIIARGMRVLMDDRNLMQEIKLKDANMINAPVQINIGSYGLQSGDVELYTRSAISEKDDASFSRALMQDAQLIQMKKMIKLEDVSEVACKLVCEINQNKN